MSNLTGSRGSSVATSSLRAGVWRSWAGIAFSSEEWSDRVPVSDVDRIDGFRLARPRRFSKTTVGGVLLGVAGIVAGFAYLAGAGGGGEPPLTTLAAVLVPPVHDFPDAHDEPPAGWTGPVFRLS